MMSLRSGLFTQGNGDQGRREDVEWFEGSNVVSPDLMIEKYGADATRMYALFAAPPDRDLDWQEEGVAGISRFLGKVYRLTDEVCWSCEGWWSTKPDAGWAGFVAEAAPDDCEDHA